MSRRGFYKRTLKTRRKLSRSMKKLFKDPKEREKISRAKRGVPLSKAHCLAMSKAFTKKYKKKSERKKQSEIAKRMWERKSYRKKISKARKAAWKRPKSRKRLLAGLAENRKLSVRSQKPSKICKKIYKFLKKLVPGLKMEYRVDRLHVDLAFPKKKLAIEIDGWAHDYFFSMEMKDRKRDKFLKSQGWKVCRVKAPTKSKSSFDKAIRKCLRFLKKNGVSSLEIPN